MRRYESVVILDPELPDDEVKGFTEKYGQIIKNHSGEIIKLEDWGTKKLAYLVKKREKGRYILFDFVGTPELILEMERQFKISDDVMKFLSVKLDDEVDLEAFKAASKAKEAEAVEAEAPVAEAVVEPVAEPVAEPAATPIPEEAAEIAAEPPQEPTETEPGEIAEQPAAAEQPVAESAKEPEQS